MPAFQVLDEIFAGLFNDAGMAARSTIIAEHQIIVALTADQKRNRLQQSAAAIARRINDCQRRQSSGGRRWHARRGQVALRDSSVAAAISFARSAWQCEQ